jgi:hypothetical protein
VAAHQRRQRRLQEDEHADRRVDGEEAQSAERFKDDARVLRPGQAGPAASERQVDTVRYLDGVFEKLYDLCRRTPTSSSRPTTASCSARPATSATARSCTTSASRCRYLEGKTSADRARSLTFSRHSIHRIMSQEGLHPVVHRPLRRGQEHPRRATSPPVLRSAASNVEVLDGDEVRENLSKGLGFSKEDRDTNVRRIGFVANLLARTASCAITAAISPYRAGARRVRARKSHDARLRRDLRRGAARRPSRSATRRASTRRRAPARSSTSPASTIPYEAAEERPRSSCTARQESIERSPRQEDPRLPRVAQPGDPPRDGLSRHRNTVPGTIFRFRPGRFFEIRCQAHFFNFAPIAPKRALRARRRRRSDGGEVEKMCLAPYFKEPPWSKPEDRAWHRIPEVMNPAGSQGVLCLGGSVGRFNQLVGQADAAGTYTICTQGCAPQRTFSLNQIPQPTGAVAVAAGETWRFQCWFRDSQPGGPPTSNFTHARQLTFQ